MSYSAEYIQGLRRKSRTTLEERAILRRASMVQVPPTKTTRTKPAKQNEEAMAEVLVKINEAFGEVKTFYINDDHDFALHELIYVIPYAWTMPENGEYIDEEGSVRKKLPVDEALIIRNLSKLMEEAGE